MEQGRVTDVIYLDFCKALDIVPQNIYFSRLGRYEAWNIQWIRKQLGGCNNSVEDTEHSDAGNATELRGGIQWDVHKLLKWAH